MPALQSNTGSSYSLIQAGRYLLALLLPFLFLGTATDALIEVFFHQHQESHWWLSEEESKALEKEKIEESERESKDSFDDGDSDDWTTVSACLHPNADRLTYQTYFNEGFSFPFAIIKSHFPPHYLSHHSFLE